MENGGEEADVPTNESQTSSHEVQESTEISVKTSTLVMKSESSHMSSSTLTTEPITLDTDESLQITAAATETSESSSEQKTEERLVTESESSQIMSTESSSELGQSTEKTGETSAVERTEDLVETSQKADESTPVEAPEPIEAKTEEHQEPMDTDTDALQTQDKQDESQGMTDEKEVEADDKKEAPQKQKEEKGNSEIKEENIRNQLHEIINDIDNEVGNEEDGPRHHTWKPKGNYEIEKTEIEYEDIVPCKIPDVQVKDQPKKVPKTNANTSQDDQQGQEDLKQDASIDSQKILRHAVINGEPISPMEIPVGIPLLAKILPKEESGDEEQREKIPLERLFTPATDVDEILPQNKKKAFASSCFYRPDHPTIDDQVELAHKISVSLVDENNKASKGQNMYMKRKNRSSKWIHQGEEGEIISAASQFDQEEPEEERKPNLEKPNLKLVLSPKVTQDFNAVQRHYEELVSSTTATTQHITRMEVGKEIATNLESPTGKGAALFAKRKKRMDKFIVDETTVQQQQQQSLQEESSMTQMSSVASQMTQESSSLTADQTMHMNNGPAFIEPVPIVPPGNLKLPDLSQILTQPKPPEKKTSSSLKSTTSTISRSKSESVRSRSTDSKSSSSGKPAGFGAAISPASQKPKGQILGKQGEKSSNKVVPPHSQNDSSLLNSTEKVQRPIEDSLNDLRPGSPPVFLVPDGNGSFREAEVKTEPTEATIETKETPANNAFQETENLVRPSSPTQQPPSQLYNSQPFAEEMIRSKPANKPTRPNSLPLIPFVSFNTPSLCSLSSDPPQPSLSDISPTYDKHGFPTGRKDMSFSLKNSPLSNFTPSLSDTNELRSVTNSHSIVESFNNRNVNVEIKPVSSLQCTVSSFVDKPSHNGNLKFTNFVHTDNRVTDANKSPISPIYLNLDTRNTSPLINVSSSNSFTISPKPYHSPTKELSQHIQRKLPPISDSIVYTSPSLVLNTIEEEPVTVSQIDETHSKQVLPSLLNGGDTVCRDTTSDILPNISKKSSSVLSQNKETIGQKEFKNVSTNLKTILDDLESVIVTEAQRDKDLKDDYELSSPLTSFKDIEASNEVPNRERNNENVSNSEDVKISVEHKDSLVNEEEIKDFIQDIERSFSATPVMLDNINIHDLQPPEFYRSVSRSSLNDENNEEIMDILNQNKESVEENGENEDGFTFHQHRKDYIWIGNAEKVTPTFDPFYTSKNRSYSEKLKLHLMEQNKRNENTFLTPDTDAHTPETLATTQPYVQPIISSTFNSKSKLENFAMVSETKSYPWSAEGGAIYTAEVKVVQKPSLPSPMSLPDFSALDSSLDLSSSCLLVDQLTTTKEEEKRKSFNLAPKGWGTYSNFYTPVHLGV